MSQRSVTTGGVQEEKGIPGFRGGGIYPVLFFLMLFLLGYSLVRYHMGADNSLDWILISNTDPSTISFDQFNIGLFSFDIPADNYLVWQAFSPSNLHIDYQHFYYFLIALAIGLSAFQTATSRMSRYPFIVCSLIFTLLYSMIHIEEILLFGISGRIPVFVIIGIHLLAGYLFSFIYKNISATVRFLVFLLLHGATAFAIAEFSPLRDPLLIITPYAFLSGAILAVAFIALVSQEVIFGILYITTRPTVSAGSNGRHFLILGAIYLVNLLLLYFRNAEIILTDLAIINEMWVLVLSSVVALFTIRYKNTLFPRYPFRPYIYLLLAGLGIQCFTLLSFQFVITNNPAIDAFKDIISFIHLGFGFMFYAYVILNFLGALYQSVPVYRIVYKEINFPYVTGLLAGLAIIAGMFFYSDKQPYYEVLGAHYNIQGDTQQALEDFNLAESYYKGAVYYGGNNQKSFYHLAAFATYDQREADTRGYLEKALKKRPSEHVYISLADFYKRKGDFFNALFTLRDGLERYPESAFLRNNLAMQYAQANILDSAIYYFDPGFYADKWKSVSRTNNWFIYAKSNQIFPADSVNELLGDATIPYNSNLIAYANLKNQPLDLSVVDLPRDSVLNSYTFPLLNNVSLNGGRNKVDSLGQRMMAAAQHYRNSDLKHLLDYDMALISYAANDFNGFLRYMDAAQVGASAAEKGEYLNTIGLVCLKLNAPRLAVNYFGSALENKFEAARINYGVALNEAHMVDDAVRYWNYILNNEADSVHHQIAFNQLNILKLSPEEVRQNDSDPVTYQYLRIFGQLMSYEDFILLTETIENNNMKADLLMSYAKDEIAGGDYENLDQLMARLGDIPLQSTQLATRRLALGVSYAGIKNDMTLMASMKEQLSNIDNAEDKWVLLRLAAPDRDSVQTVRIYRDMGLRNPFDAPAVLRASEWFRNQGDTESAYEILLNAVEINPYSIPLLKAYAITALEQYLFEFADEVLPELEKLMEKQEYDEFLNRYKSKKKELEEVSVWDR